MIGLNPAYGNPTVAPVQLPHEAQQHYYAIAEFLMNITHKILSWFHVQNNSEWFVFVYAVLVFIISFGVGYLLQWVTVKIGRHFAKTVKSLMMENLLNERFFTQVARIIPAILFLILTQYTLFAHAQLSDWLTRLTWVYIIFLLGVALSTLANVIWLYFDNRDNKKKLPLQGIATLIKGIIWIVAIIIIVALIVNKSPAKLLTGVGAFAAVLMLVFKDSIMGVVAGVQLSENDSLHEGDWIAAGDANGVVQEVSLTAIKIENWNKTITTLPPYSLVSNGFTNYRNMQASDTRLVQRSYMIDSESVVETDDAMLDEFAKIPLIADWITKKRAQKAAGKVENVLNSEGLVDGSIETNLGIYRAYLQLYLLQNPNVAPQQNDGFTVTFVTTLQQTSAGIPLQLYFFTKTSAWIAYEGIMADIFEHIAISMRKFRLYTYDYPSGRDMLVDAYIEQGKNPGQIPGIPPNLLPTTN